MNANSLHSIANWLLVTSLVIGVLSTYAIVVTGKIKEKNAEKELAQAAESAAKAHERAAFLEAEAATARLETERIKSLVAWRRISEKQHNLLVHELTGKISRKVWVGFVKLDPEATRYQLDIQSTLDDAGIKTQFFSGWEQAIGLQITNSETDDGRLIVEAFRKAGIEFEKMEEPGLKNAEEDIEIIIGTRPPTFYKYK